MLSSLQQATDAMRKWELLELDENDNGFSEKAASFWLPCNEGEMPCNIWPGLGPSRGIVLDSRERELTPKSVFCPSMKTAPRIPTRCM